MKRSPQSFPQIVWKQDRISMLLSDNPIVMPPARPTLPPTQTSGRAQDAGGHRRLCRSAHRFFIGLGDGFVVVGLPLALNVSHDFVNFGLVNVSAMHPQQT